ncbi:hypothetical protein DC904_00940 [Vibrio parahaemolyticus]|nr:hypothetical protein [Vibrio parahaemolyticus]
MLVDSSKNSVMKKSVVISALTLAISGCASTPNESIESQGKYADDYALNVEEFSEATRFYYPLRWIEPERNANNLDKFYYDIDSHKELANTSSVATVVAAGLGNITSFDAVMGLLAQQGSRSGYDSLLGEQFLYTIIQVDTNKDLDTQAQYVNRIAVDTIKMVMGSEAKEEYQKVGSEGFYFLDRIKVTSTSDETCTAVYSPCYSLTARIPMLIRDNDGYIPLAPQGGDYMAAKTYLPIGFPIEQIKFANVAGVEQFLYVPAVKMNGHKDLWRKENLSYFTGWYNQQRISINPYIKRLSDDTVFYFNPKITAKQKDRHSLYRVFNLSD